ncbi:hypothetical protein DSO57_1002891 [Entomophthora muscae]|uniref:Uncharacterized protein n=1 Tax=Entomophthora muscae TaxID=34485 RepID=A0ACC2SL95_9FUNG|nr:hypothetical protein DSO57_1002891 [Entomophthora muscae]
MRIQSLAAILVGAAAASKSHLLPSLLALESPSVCLPSEANNSTASIASRMLGSPPRHSISEQPQSKVAFYIATLSVVLLFYS